VVWKDSEANYKRCKVITRLLFSGVGVWSTSGFKGLFSKLKKINIHMQHRGPEKVEYIGHAVNPAGLVLLRSRQLGARPKNDLRLGKYILNGHPT
jgi:hypothetical protein